LSNAEESRSVPLGGTVAEGVAAGAAARRLPYHVAGSRPDAVRAMSQEVIAGFLQVADFVVVLGAGVVAYLAYVISVVGDRFEYDRYGMAVLAAAIMLVAVLKKTDSYDFRRLPRLRIQLMRVAAAWIATTAVLATLAFVIKMATFYSRGWSITWVVLTFSGLAFVRVSLFYLLRQWTRSGRLTRKVAVVGAGDIGERLVSRLLASNDSYVRITGVFDDRLSRVPGTVCGCPVLGTTDELIAMARQYVIDEVIIALPLRADHRIGELVSKLKTLPVDLRLSIDDLGGFPLRGVGATAAARTLEILDRPLKHWSGMAKWLEDRILGVLLLAALAPVLAIIALLVKLDSNGPAFFMQNRFGLNNKVIRVLKFRTMYADRSNPPGEIRTVPDDPRVTRIGRVLRRFSLDELPQLINVLRGEMSLVGPRPHAVAMRAGTKLYYEAVGEYFLRHRVRPGMTGWAQVNGHRGEIDTEEKARGRVAYDLWYIDHWSFWLDLKILAMTAMAVVKQDNAY
jgi:Undecaprenyl-phosphate glucose phosphotransferase